MATDIAEKVFGIGNRGKRIVIGGTYGVGKTTTTDRLVSVTGIRPTKARQMRELIADIYPGQALETLPPTAVYRLILERFSDRKAQEQVVAPYGFISDGSALHEWAYGTARIVHGANGPGSEISDPGFIAGMGVYGEVAKRHAKEMYTHVVHLPIEFVLPRDGHRPVSEDFRKYADELILKTWREIGFEPIIIGGTLDERISKISNAFGLEVSPTINTPKSCEGGLWYAQIEDALGPRDERFFSHRFRHSDGFLTNVYVSEDGTEVRATGSMSYLSAWSLKRGGECERHLSSSDAFLLFGQMAQLAMYTADGISREESNNMWLRTETLRTPGSILCSEEGFPITLRVVKREYHQKGDKIWHYATMTADFADGSFVIPEYKVAYLLPERVAARHRTTQ